MKPFQPPEGAPFPVAHSIISADFLAHEVNRLYDLGGHAEVHLLYRGMNDVYVIHVGDKKFAMRCWRLWRGETEVALEIEYLDFLKSVDFPAAYAVHAKDGAGYFPVPAPEGERYAAVFEWAPGEKFRDALDMGTAERIGELLATMHIKSLTFRTDQAPARHTLPLPLDNPVLNILLEGRPDELRDYPKLAAAINREMAALADKGLGWGQSHTDFHPSNLHVDKDGTITFLDFDASAPGYLAFDVANNIFAHGFYGIDMAYADAFLKGYERVRPLSDAEKAAMPLLLLYKTYSLMDGIASNVNSVGHNALRIRGLDWFWSQLRPMAAELKLL